MNELELLNGVDTLQNRYILSLDQKNFQDWLDCFSEEEGAYLCLSSENEEQGLPLALMMDDSPARLRDRVKFISEVWAGTFDDYKTRHFVQRLDWSQASDDVITVRSNFAVMYTSGKGRSEVLACGTYEDEIGIGNGAPKFKTKKAILDTVTTPRYLVFPI